MTYQAGQRVILFRTAGPVLAWVATDRFYPAVQTVDGRLMVSVSTHEEEAASGRGMHVLAKRLHPYTDDLWAACEQWHERKSQLAADLAALEQGRIPQEYLQPGLRDLA